MLPLVISKTLPPGSCRLAAASTVVIARPPSTGCALLIALLSCPTGRGVVARLAPLLSQLQRGHELVLSQLA